ncbi:hypothetical protein A4X13_0g1718 [Tilletia indica]|uniref:Uncharacterized protein n=1 Tax=Tilletia indica TaxID=43049 RepID=A0A8T8TD68_9BASI|nr:hypothetical protein A4X13_0g1718 [Tilletia indica]
MDMIDAPSPALSVKTEPDFDDSYFPSPSISKSKQFRNDFQDIVHCSQSTTASTASAREDQGADDDDFMDVASNEIAVKTENPDQQLRYSQYPALDEYGSFDLSTAAVKVEQHLSSLSPPDAFPDFNLGASSSTYDPCLTSLQDNTFWNDLAGYPHALPTQPQSVLFQDIVQSDVSYDSRGAPVSNTELIPGLWDDTFTQSSFLASASASASTSTSALAATPASAPACAPTSAEFVTPSSLSSLCSLSWLPSSSSSTSSSSLLPHSSTAENIGPAARCCSAPPPRASDSPMTQGELRRIVKARLQQCVDKRVAKGARTAETGHHRKARAVFGGEDANLQLAASTDLFYGNSCTVCIKARRFCIVNPTAHLKCFHCVVDGQTCSNKVRLASAPSLPAITPSVEPSKPRSRRSRVNRSLSTRQSSAIDNHIGEALTSMMSASSNFPTVQLLVQEGETLLNTSPFK